MAPHIQDGKERASRERFIADTYRDPIEKISGWSRLKDVFGFEDDVLAAFKSWLALPRPDPDTSSNVEGFNADHAVIRDGSKVRVGIRSYDQVFKRETWDLLTETDFSLLHHKSAEARNWLKSPERLTYRNGFVFDPTGKNHRDALNLWRGFAIKPVEGEWSTIDYHILHVLAAGNEEHHQYILKWFAWLYQNPSKPAEVAVIFRGGRGTGKGILCRAIIRSLGQHGIHISTPTLMTGRFNAHFRDCIALFADEAFWAGDKSGEGQLKRIITEDTLVVEAKNRDAIVVRNMLHIMIASNEDWIVPSGTDVPTISGPITNLFTASDRNSVT
ncbi:primase-helicase family protein [Aestuariivirga sp.]|uniref:primase-helicase family protein n=1 Tax=Aestuariivirga sp. TaxID=2650926 RepID=UPI003593CFA9